LDIGINNGKIVDYNDGLYEANIGIENGVIQKITQKKVKANKIIDAKGKIISPGFIDIHMHEDKLKEGKIKLQIFNNMVLMGVTTAVGGNCGLGTNNIKKYYNKLTEAKPPINYLGLVGHGVLRKKVGCEDNYKSVNELQIKQMKEILKKELSAGALGISFGLEYIPGANIQELIELSKVVSDFESKLVSAHYRFDAQRSLESIGELIIISRDVPVKMQVSHLGSCIAFGEAKAGLKMIEVAHQAGVDIMADCYPYNSFSTYIGSAVFDDGCFKRWNVGYEAIKVCGGKYKGRSCNKEIFNYLREKEPDTLVIAFVMNEKEVIKILKHPLVMIASDGLVEDGYGHPRAAGTFPRVLGKYVREEKELDLVNAIEKMTVMPAKRIGLDDRGKIKEGYKADITLFDLNEVIDKSNYNEPLAKPKGIDTVIVSGKLIVKNGLLTGNKAGKVCV